MKTFITTILKTFMVSALFIGGAIFADAAGQFDNDPADQGTGFLSIAEGNSCSNCANEDNSITVNIPDYNDSERFTVYMDYRNQGNATIYNVRGKLTEPNSSGRITGTLSGSGASSISDSVYVYGLPNSYDFEFVSGYVENTHGTTDPSYCAGYNHYVTVSGNQVLGSGAPIGDLDTHESGWCDQGYLIVTFEVTNTTDNTPNYTYSWQTGSWGQCINGVKYRDVYCEEDQTGNEVSNSNCSNSGAQPASSSTSGCSGSGGDDLEVDTNNETNLGTTTVTLNGEIESGETNQVFFVLSYDDSFSCTSGYFTAVYGVNFSGNYPLEAGDTFSADRSGLTSDTDYYYRACAQEIGSSTIKQGPVEHFSTDDNGNTTSTTVETHNPTLSGDDVVLNGEIQDVDNDDYTVYFALSDSSSVSCTNGITSIHLIVDDNIGSDQDFEYELQDALDTLPNGDYYYKACAINEDNGNIISGNIEDFEVEDSSGPSGSFVVETRTEQSVTESSAKLRGYVDMSSYQDGDVFFVWGEDLSQIQDVSDENRYSDIDSDGDNLQKQKIENNFDGDSTFSLNVNGLNTNERIYFRLCVEYEHNGNDDIKCGIVEDFETEDYQNNNVQVVTLTPGSVTQTTAEMCGDLREDGGSSQQTWIEFRTTNQNSYTSTPTSQRSEGDWCTRVSGLTPNTTYLYRACTPHGCAPTRTLRTLGQNIPIGQAPIISTENPTNITSNSAYLSGLYITNAPSGTCWFNYGRTAALGKQTRTYNVGSGYGTCSHNFTNLASGTQYCVQSVIRTQYGTDTGAIKCFNTPNVVSVGNPQPPVTITVVEEDETEIDLLGLGLGLSLIRLDIDNDEEVVTRGESVEYEIEWENISELDLEDLELEVTIPQEIQITDISRGRLDNDSNKIYLSIDELYGADYEDNRPGESGRMTVSGIVGRGTVGNLLTADAEIVYDNPVNEAQENARDFDLDEYGVQVAGVTASVFGLTNITFLGWLVILLGLFIIFLVARWLYLEREDLRAQAYIGGYNNPYGGAPRYDNGYAAQAPVYREPAPRFDAPVAPAPQDDYYQPYRPNRG